MVTTINVFTGKSNPKEANLAEYREGSLSTEDCFKLAIKIGDKSLLEHTVDAWLEGGANVNVLHEPELTDIIHSLLGNRPVNHIITPQKFGYKFSTVKTGGLMGYCGGDMLLTVSDAKKLLALVENSDKSIVIPIPDAESAVNEGVISDLDSWGVYNIIDEQGKKRYAAASQVGFFDPEKVDIALLRKAGNIIFPKRNNGMNAKMGRAIPMVIFHYLVRGRYQDLKGLYNQLRVYDQQRKDGEPVSIPQIKEGLQYALLNPNIETIGMPFVKHLSSITKDVDTKDELKTEQENYLLRHTA